MQMIFLCFFLFATMELNRVFDYSLSSWGGFSWTMNSPLGFLTAGLLALCWMSLPHGLLTSATLIGAYLFFYSADLLSFFFLFESTLTPMILLLLMYGYQAERLQATVYLVLYTFSTSLPLLLFILSLYESKGSINFLLLQEANINNHSTLYYIVLLGFMVKLPLYGLHGWLPKAHVEAPIGGSVVLAGVMLKLGGVGLAVFLFMLQLPPWFMVVAMVYGLYGGLLSCWECLKQTDIKALIAYSSVVHMAAMPLCFSLAGLAATAGNIMLYVHGWISAALFLGAQALYQMRGTRNLAFLSGFGQTSAALSYTLLYFLCLNMSLPPSLGVFSEILLAGVLGSLSWMLLLSLGVIIFFGGVYNMCLLLWVVPGRVSPFACLPKEASFLPLSLMAAPPLMSIFLLSGF